MTPGLFWWGWGIIWKQTCEYTKQARGSGETQAIDSLITLYGGKEKKKKKRKNKFACFFLNSIRPPRERKEKVGSLNQHCSSTKTTWLSREGTAGFHTSIFQPIREEVGIKSILQPTHCLCRAWTLLHLKQRKIKMPWTTEEQPASRGAFLYQ